MIPRNPLTAQVDTVKSGLKFIAKIFAGVCALAASHHNAEAKRLSGEICVKLVNEHAELSKNGIEKTMKADPEIARTKLQQKQMERIERFLFIEGQIRFRCPEIKLPGLGVPKPSKQQAVKVDKNYSATIKKKQIKKPKGPSVPLPSRNPGRKPKNPG